MKKIKNRGRTLDAVVNPNHYMPFSSILDVDTFEKTWLNNPSLIFANMSHAAYFDKNFLIELFKKFGAKIKFYESEFNEGGVKRGREAFLAIWKDKAILSFRGTEANEKLQIKINNKNNFLNKFTNIKLQKEVGIPFLPTDIIDDLYFIPKTYGEGINKSQIHSGFLNATKELFPNIQKDIDHLRLSDPSQIYVTGHSLGAAMAVVAGALGSFKMIVTFGEPSVGNNLDNTIDKNCKHIRYVNGIDPVTKIIPKFLFEHHGELRSITDIDGPDFRYDHSIINYSIILETTSP